VKCLAFCHEAFWNEAKGNMTRDKYGLAYQKGFDLTVRFLLSRGAQREYAMEVAQGAWVRGWERLHQLRDEATVVTWVNTIALNAYRRVMRREAPSQELPEIVSPHGIDMAAIDVHRILNFCRPSERMLFEQQMHGATTEEIARKQGVTETAIRIRLLRARRATRSRLEKRATQLQDRYSSARAVRDAA
jgi:DNA-directed RNA polymerase specialized sigma24 family protein